jgi:hypothetical protein
MNLLEKLKEKLELCLKENSTLLLLDSTTPENQARILTLDALISSLKNTISSLDPQAWKVPIVDTKIVNAISKFSSSIPIDESFSSFETEMETFYLRVPIWQDYLFIVLHDDPVKRSFLKTHSLDCTPRLSWNDLKDRFIQEYLTEMEKKRTSCAAERFLNQ